MATATGLIFHCSMSLCPETCLFTIRSRSNICILILPKLTFVLHSSFHYLIGDNLRYVNSWYALWCKTWVLIYLLLYGVDSTSWLCPGDKVFHKHTFRLQSIVLAKLHKCLWYSLLWMLPKVFEELEAKQGVVIHHGWVTHPFFLLITHITGACASAIQHSIFSILVD